MNLEFITRDQLGIMLGAAMGFILSGLLLDLGIVLPLYFIILGGVLTFITIILSKLKLANQDKKVNK